MLRVKGESCSFKSVVSSAFIIAISVYHDLLILGIFFWLKSLDKLIEHIPEASVTRRTGGER